MPISKTSRPRKLGNLDQTDNYTKRGSGRRHMQGDGGTTKWTTYSRLLWVRLHPRRLEKLPELVRNNVVKNVRVPLDFLRA